MRADGKQLADITSLIDAGIIKPVIDKIYHLDEIKEAITYVESGRSKGKVVVKIK